MENNFTLVHELNRIIERLNSLCNKPILGFEDQRKIKQGTVEGLVSIILPVGKDAPSFKTCIQNISQHTAVPYEIIFSVNPLNQEKISQYLKHKFYEEIDFQTVFRSENRGLAQACNEAIMKSRGEYIVLLSPNALVTRNWLPTMLMNLNRTPDSGVIGPMTNLEKGVQHAVGSNDISSKEIDRFAEKLKAENHCRRIPTYRVEHFCILFSRKLFNSIGGFDEELGVNGGAVSDFCLRALINGKTNLIAGDVYIHQERAKVPLSKKYFKLKWHSPNPETHFGKEQLMLKSIQGGVEAYQKDNFDEAIKLLMQGIQHLPYNPTPYFELAEILTQSNSFKDALNVITELPSEANELRKNEMLGYCSLGLNLDEDALQFAEHAISIDQKSAPAYNLLGLIALKHGNREKAASFFQQSAAADPGYGEPHANLGKIFLENAPEKALNYIERGFILSPHIPDILSAYHSIITDLEQYQRAEPVFESAVSAYPLNKNLRYRFIDVLYRLGKLEEALKQVQESLVRFGSEEGMMAAALKIREMAGPKEIPKAKRARKTALSICMITKNEEAFLPDCLHSVTPIADEIILVDTGSTDQTKDIATIFGARVYDFKWNEDFSKARNFSLSQANGDWIFVFDADEALSPLDHEHLLKLIQKSTGRPQAYSFITRNYVEVPNVAGWTGNEGQYLEEEKGAGWHPSPKIRLFPNGKGIRSQNPVHEFVEPSLIEKGVEIKQSDIPIHHYGQLDRGKYLSIGKCEEAVELWKRVLQIDPQNTKALINMSSALMRLKKYEAARKACETALKISPGLIEASHNFCLCELLMGGDLDQIASILEKLLDSVPEHPAAIALLGSTRAIQGEHKQAAEKMQILGNTGFSRSYYLQDLSQKLSSAGQTQTAVLLLQFAVESGNANQEIRELLRGLEES